MAPRYLDERCEQNGMSPSIPGKPGPGEKTPAWRDPYRGPLAVAHRVVGQNWLESCSVSRPVDGRGSGVAPSRRLRGWRGHSAAYFGLVPCSARAPLSRTAPRGGAPDARKAARRHPPDGTTSISLVDERCRPMSATPSAS